jgi:hypothetical protein
MYESAERSEYTPPCAFLGHECAILLLYSEQVNACAAFRAPRKEQTISIQHQVNTPANPQNSAKPGAQAAPQALLIYTPVVAKLLSSLAASHRRT